MLSSRMPLCFKRFVPYIPRHLHFLTDCGLNESEANQGQLQSFLKSTFCDDERESQERLKRLLHCNADYDYVGLLKLHDHQIDL